MNVGILGIALHLPPEVRRNDWWPADVVARWAARLPPALPAPGATEGAAPGAAEDAVSGAMRAQAADPFQGTRERRVLAPEQTLLQLEVGAARGAIERAGLERGEIDLLLSDSLGHPVLATNAACGLHHALGLRPDCLSLQTNGTQHAFVLQLALAEALIATGRARFAVVVQSSAASRLLDHADPLSAVFGDGATAAVLGLVASGFGVLAVTHRTDGAHPNGLVASVPGGAWYDPGRAYLHVADPAALRGVVAGAVERSIEGLTAALARAGVDAGEIKVFAMHQGTPWLRRLVQERAGLHAAQAVDTFFDMGHLFGACTLSTLVVAEQRGLLHDGDLVAIASGGNGMTYGAAIVRWGRA